LNSHRSRIKLSPLALASDHFPFVSPDCLAQMVSFSFSPLVSKIASICERGEMIFAQFTFFSLDFTSYSTKEVKLSQFYIFFLDFADFFR
jgi:hypothetical protein